MIINLDNPKPDKCCDFDNKLAEEVILSESYDQVNFDLIGMNSFFLEYSTDIHDYTVAGLLIILLLSLMKIINILDYSFVLK